MADGGARRARLAVHRRRCRRPDLRAGRIVAALIAVVALAALWNFIRRTNFQVSRFIESVRFEDYSQRFSDPSGGGFDVLGDTLDAALKPLQARHMKESAEARYLSAILDDSPSALVDDQDGRVELLNKAARQLFARRPMTARLRRARRRTRGGGPAAARDPQDHPADARRRSA